MAQLESFIKRQSLRGIAIDLAKALQRDTEESLEEAEALIGKARQSRLKIFDPGTRLSDKSRSLAFLDIKDQSFPTGIPELDKRGFGPTRKEMWLYIANTKAGKCVVEGELVLCADGSYLPIEKFPPEVRVPSFNEKTGRFETRNAWLKFNGVKKAFVITTRMGRTVRLTGNHPLLTKNGWKAVSEIGLGEKIALPLSTPFFGHKTMPDKHAKALGYMIADGGMSKKCCITFSKKDSEILKDFDACLKVLGCIPTQLKGKPANYSIRGGCNQRGNGLINLLRQHNLMSKKSNVKELSQEILRLNKAAIKSMLSALFTCDGSIYGTKPTFEYSTTSPVLAQQVDQLLTRFGLVAKIRERHQTVSGKPYVSWGLIIGGRGQIETLHNEIGLLGAKGRKLANYVNADYPRPARGNYNTRDQEGMVFFDPVVSIKPIGLKPTYDLSVEGSHNFIAGNILVHNTWALIQLAKMAMVHKLKVCHLTLEMSEARAAQRYFQSLFAMAKRKEAFPTTKFRRDELGRMTGFEDVKITPKITLDDPNVRTKLEHKIDKWAARLLDNIIIKEFPTGALTVNEMTAYLDNLEATQQFVPDLLIIDYPDLMRLNKSERSDLAIGEIYKDIRGVLVNRNIAGAIVSQSHRAGAKAKQLGADNVAEAYNKIAHADTIITYSQTPQEHKLGLARLFVAGGRNDEDKLTIVISQQYGMGNFVMDSALMVGDYWKNFPSLETEE